MLEIIGLLLIIATGSPQLDTLPAIVQTLPPLTDIQIWPGIFIGAFLAFYAFIGFEDMVNVAEEVKQPEKNMPRAIIIALIVSTLLYVMTSLIAVVNLSPEALSASKAPLADIYTAATGNKPVVITLIGLFAVINGALIQVIMATRIFYGMSNKGWLPKIFAQVSKRTQTPVFSTVLVVLGIAFLALWFPLQKLAESTSYLVLMIFFLVNLALLSIRKKYELPAHVRGNSIWIPIMGALARMIHKPLTQR